jgi:hypothetical protein
MILSAQATASLIVKRVRGESLTACSFAVSAHVCWNWAVRAARTAIPLFILGRTWSTFKSLDMSRLGSIRRPYLITLLKLIAASTWFSFGPDDSVIL